MGKHETYTQEEILSNICRLEFSVERLKGERSELSREISSKKKQIIIWQEMNLSQYKLFK